MNSDKGTASIEYAIMAGFIAVVIVGAVTAIGLKVLGFFVSVLPAFG
jgi:Flp pilus assembly pilin Flp